jgi:tetratricopeptide (TPR) repeat protein/transcriptional regulator with XRE-family HTH domain
MNTHQKGAANQRLREERILRGWSQQYVAEQIGADSYYLSRWEHGKMLPSPYYREKLCALFGKNARELGFMPQESKHGQEVLENLPNSAGREDPGVHDPAIPPLPGVANALVGRQELLSTLKARLCAETPSAVVALNGLPGVGKTALAIALAHDKEVLAHFRDGILWAAAGKNPDVMGILSHWGMLLGIPPAEAAHLTTRDAWAQAVRTAIGARQMLLIIDDAWTLEELVSFKVGGSSCAYLVTTRFPLLAWHVAADGALPVHELSEADSMILLDRLAPLVVKSERLAAEEIALLVGGLPLALLLVGNFLRVQAYNGQPRRVRQAIERLRTVEMRLHLQEPQALLERSPSLVNAPAISLHTLIAVSDQQLDEAARVALYAFSVFPAKPNTFSEDVALAVCQGSVEILDTLSDAGLLESYMPDRYALHQTIADYARLHRVDASPIERMVRYVADFVGVHEKDYLGLEQESANILAALNLANEYGYLEALIMTGNTFAAFLRMRGSFTEARNLLARVRQAATSLQDQQGLATALYHLGEIAMSQGEYAQASSYFQEGLSLVRALHNRPLMSRLLRTLGSVEGYQGDYSQAEVHLQEALALARQLEDDELLSLALRSMGAVVSDQGKFAQAEDHLKEGLSLARRLGKPDLICSLLVNLGQVALVRGYYAQAEEVIREALEIASQIGYRPAMCLLQSHLGISALEQGKYSQAHESFQQALMLSRRIEHREYLVGALANLGQLARKQGNHTLAESYLQEGLAIVRAMDSPWLLAGMLDEWGELCLCQGGLAEAAAAFDEMYLVGVRGSQEYEALARYGQARVAAAQGKLIEARQHGHASLALLKSMEHYKVAEVEQWLATCPDGDTL